MSKVRFRFSIASALGAAFLFSSCAGIPGESPEHMRARVERDDKVYDRIMEKRAIRHETADRRYDQWWDAAMGRNDSDYSQW